MLEEHRESPVQTLTKAKTLDETLLPRPTQLHDAPAIAPLRGRSLRLSGLT